MLFIPRASRHQPRASIVRVMPYSIQQSAIRIGTLCGLSLLLIVAPARAAGLSLGWQDSRAEQGPGLPEQTFSCIAPAGSGIPLFPAFVLAAPIDSVIAMEFVVDVIVAGSELPPWWRIGLEPCRPLGWSIDVVPAASALDPWDGGGVGGSLAWTPGQPFGHPAHGRLIGATAVLPGSQRALSAGVPYSVGRILLMPDAVGTCPGCSLPACLVFNSLLIRRMPGASPEEVLLVTPESAGENQALWQGGQGSDCRAVPVRRRTWTDIKMLYR